MIILTAEITAAPGFEKDVEDALLAMIPEVQKETDTLNYTLHRKKDDPSVFLYYEAYKDEDALSYHGATPYFKELGKALDGKLAKNPEETFYTVIGSIER
jgi:quinol monooxygenase YgiN